MRLSLEKNASFFRDSFFSREKFAYFFKSKW